MTTKDFKTLLKRIGFNSISEYTKHLGYSNINQLYKPSYRKLREKLLLKTILEYFKINIIELFEVLDSHEKLKRENKVLRDKLEKIKIEAGE